MKTTTQELKNLFLGTATLITLVAWSTNSLAQTYDEGCQNILNRTRLPSSEMGHTQWTSEASMDGGNYKPCTAVKDSQGNGRRNTRCGNLLFSGYGGGNYAGLSALNILDKNGRSWYLFQISDPNNLRTSKCSIQGDYAQETQTWVQSFKNDLLPIGKVTFRSIWIINYKITRPNF